MLVVTFQTVFTSNRILKNQEGLWQQALNLEWQQAILIPLFCRIPGDQEQYKRLKT